jgi:hypothetical protein
MVVGPIDYGDFDVRFAQALRGPQAAKPAAENDDLARRLILRSMRQAR